MDEYDDQPPSITEAVLSDLRTRDEATRSSAQAVLALHLGIRLDQMLTASSEHGLATPDLPAVAREFRINMADVMGAGAANDPRSATDDVSNQRAKRRENKGLPA